MVVENCAESHKPVEIGDLRLLTFRGRGEIYPGAETLLTGR